MVKLVLIAVPTIYLSGNPSSHRSSLAYLFQVAVQPFYVGHFKDLLRLFLGSHAFSGCDYGSFRSMHIEETLHRTDSVSISVAISVEELGSKLKLF